MNVDQLVAQEKAARTVADQDNDLVIDQELDSEPVPLLQPEPRHISHDRLTAEVKAIYAGLILVETKCIDENRKQSQARKRRIHHGGQDSPMNNDKLLHSFMKRS